MIVGFLGTLAVMSTTIFLKDIHFHIELALKQRKFLHFAFQGEAYKYSRLLFGYLLAPLTFRKCFYLDYHIFLTRKKESHMTPYSASVQLRFHSQLTEKQPPSSTESIWV